MNIIKMRPHPQGTPMLDMFDGCGFVGMFGGCGFE